MIGRIDPFEDYAEVFATTPLKVESGIDSEQAAVLVLVFHDGSQIYRAGLILPDGFGVPHEAKVRFDKNEPQDYEIVPLGIPKFGLVLEDIEEFSKELLNSSSVIVGARDHEGGRWVWRGDTSAADAVFSAVAKFVDEAQETADE